MEEVGNRARAHLFGIVAHIKHEPVYWTRWLLTVFPLFIVAPALSIGMTFYLRKQRRDIMMLTIAASNIILSIIFWHAVFDAAGEVLPKFFDFLRFPLLQARNPAFSI